MYRKLAKAKEALQFVTSAVQTGSNATLIRTELKNQYGIYLKAKDLQNLKFSIHGMILVSWTAQASASSRHFIQDCFFYIGRSSDEWDAVKKLLLRLLAVPDNIVHVTYDDQNVVSAIYIQLAEQRKLYEQYGEMVQLDGTYKTNKVGMSLYTLLIEDNYGLGQPVAWYFVRTEHQENVDAGLEIFAKNNPVTKTEVVLCDKDCTQISSIKKFFPDAEVRLCHFHVLKQVKQYV